MRNLSEIVSDLDLKEKNYSIIEKAIDDIGKLKPENSLELVLPFLQHISKSVRETAVFNLGEIKDEKAIPHIIKKIKNDEDTVKMYALFALQNYKSDIIFQTLITELNNTTLTSPIRQRLAEQLRNYPSEESRKALINIINNSNDKNAIVFAVDSLFKINDDSLRAVWKKMKLEHYHPYVSKIAGEALKNI